MKTGRINQQAAFNRSELVAVIALITLLSIIFSYHHMRQNAINRRYACIENLKLVDDLKHQWAYEQKKPNSAIPVASDLPAYMGRGCRDGPYRESSHLPFCPDDPLKKFTNSYSPNCVTNASTCKIDPLRHVLQTYIQPTNSPMNELKKLGHGTIW